MLHTVTAILSSNPTQAIARANVKALTALLTAKGYNPIAPELGEALAKDAGGAFVSLDAPDGRVIGRVQHNLSQEDVRILKADMAAFIDSPEFACLPTKVKSAPKTKAIVKPEEAYAKLQGMTVEEFGKFAEDNGVKATIDRGVWSISMPGMRGTAYFDAQTGERLAEGEDAADRKVTLDSRKAEGKLRALGYAVEFKRAKLTANQKRFIADCAVSGYDIPESLKAYALSE